MIELSTSQFINLGKLSKQKPFKTTSEMLESAENIKNNKIFKYRIIDNDFPKRNTLILATNQNEALSEGASRLRTCNIHCIELSE
jgi:hypothetical protein